MSETDEKSKLLKAFESFLDKHFGGTKKEDSGIPLVKSLDTEQMREVSVVYVPNTPDAHGEWMSEATVASMCEDLRKGFLEVGNLSLNLFHMKPLEKSQVEVVDIYLLKSEVYVDDIYVPAGSCVMEIQYHDHNLWKDRKEGNIGGFSVHGKCRFNTQSEEE